MGTYVQQVPVKFVTKVVVVGTPEYLDTQSFPFPLNISVVPNATGSVLVEYSITPNAAGKGVAATWYNWTPGSVSAKTNAALTAPVSALRFTATTANATYEVAA